MIKEEIFSIFSNVQIGYRVDSEKVISGDTRLDSSHFIDDVGYALNSKIKFTTLSKFITDVEEPTLFTRIYCDKEFGIPYISSSEMSEIEPPVNSRFISRNLTSNIEQYIIKRGQILVSAAGTVGSIVVATAELDGVAGTSDILRINLDQNKYLGFIYTYLTSSFGANELSNMAYGAIIKRVRGFQLAQLKTPIISDSIMKEMNHKIGKALENRDKANRLIKESRSLVLKYNRIPEFQSIKQDTLNFNGELEMLKTNSDEFDSSWRLDAHYYNSNAKQIIKNVRNYASDYSLLKNVCDDIILGKRFKRNYVESDHGTPFIGSKNILQIRPTELKFLSNSEISFMDDLILKRNMILIACSGSLGGTFGKTCLVYKNFEGFAASQHILRIIPNKHVDAGYLYAYLSSDYGYFSITRFRWGALIDEIDDEDMSELIIPLCDSTIQKEIGDMVREAYDLRADAIRLEDEAQELLTQSITKS